MPMIVSVAGSGTAIPKISGSMRENVVSTVHEVGGMTPPGVTHGEKQMPAAMVG